jgi:hypothetical protein
MECKSNVKFDVFLIAVLSVFLVPACAKRTKVKEIEWSQLQENVRYENVIFKNFKARTDISSHPMALTYCQASAIGYLQATGIFKRVEKESEKTYEEPTVLVEGILTEMRFVGTGGRVCCGIFSGRSYMKMEVTLIDGATRTEIATRELEGAPGAMGATWSFGYSDRQLPKNMGTLVGQFVLANIAK